MHGDLLLQLVYEHVRPVEERLRLRRSLTHALRPQLPLPSLSSPGQVRLARRVWRDWRTAVYRRHTRARPVVLSWARSRRRTDETPLPIPF